MIPAHLAIIMDGNGRWAEARGLPRRAGHLAGAEALRRTVDAAARCGVGTLTCFAFSADNWKRPAEEVGALLGLFATYLEKEQRALVNAGVRLSVIGRRDRLSPRLAARIERAERTTAGGGRLHLRLAIDYSAREAMVQAAIASAIDGPVTREAVAARIGTGRGLPDAGLDVDLLIRTGGEQRLSDFLLWECAYAELWFTGVPWPDFGESDLRSALQAFAGRGRRFGGLVTQ